MSDPSLSSGATPAAQARFVHLRLHSEYSIQDSLLRIDEAVGRAKADAMPALALTDLANVFGMVKFYSAARKRGVKPIVGCDVWVAPADQTEKPARLLLLVQDRAGYRLLCELLTRAYRDNLHRGRAIMDPQWFTEMGTEGLIALSGAQGGDLGQALLAESLDAARDLARGWAARFPDRYYVEIQRDGRPEAEAHLVRAVELAAELGLPVVATHPVQFASRDDYKAHEARVCIAEGAILADRRRPRQFSEEHYFKSQAEMAERFADLPEALENSLEIARRCNLTLELGKSRLPLFPTPEGMTLDDYLRHRAAEGLGERLALLYPDPAQRSGREPAYRERLEFELGTIIQMGFPGYFLIVADFINWAKENGVPVGPGRGSGAGSLVAYCLGITDLDPTRYDLLFERFLNPERVSMPDFDVDFCQDGRDRVIDYVKRKYGAESVSQIATFGTMAAKAVVRDTGRVLNMSYGFVDTLAKLIPMELGITLADAKQKEPLIVEKMNAEEDVKELFDLAERLEGLSRNVGMHAGGVLIAPGRLTDFCPLYRPEGSEAMVSQFDKDDVEKAGLVKFDFLGLRTLTIIDWALRYIRRLHPEAALSMEALPLDDAAAYRLLKACNTTAVFQLESRGMKDLIRRLQPDTFEDIVALVALFRPGPLGSGMVDDFINRKHGKARVDYLHPRLEGVLKPTYGVIVYQEQVMQIAQTLGGYTLGAADLLRRAMGKKKPEEMAKHRGIFVGGAVERGVDEKQAEYLFDLMEKFAEYGFNKSHSAAYALVSYQTAWLKAHYPAAFMAATLSSDMDATDKVRNFYEDAVANGLEVLAPDVNLSAYRFVPIDDRRIRYGLGAIKGTGESAIAGILKAREEAGPYADLFDFCRRVDRRIVNRRVIEALVRAGAFDGLNPNRAQQFASVGLAMEWAENMQRNAVQDSLFGEAIAEAPPALANMPEWPLKEKLAQEKGALGYYFSGHPFDAYREELAGIVEKPLAQLAPQPQPQLMAGIVLAVRTQMTRRGKMAFVLLDDGGAQVEVAVFNELFEARRDRLKEDALLIVEGKVSHDDYSGGLRVTADGLHDLEEARSRHASQLRLALNGQADAGRLRQLLEPYRNSRAGEGCAIALHYRMPAAECVIELGEAWRVRLADDLLAELRAWLKPENVALSYAKGRRAG